MDTMAHGMQDITKALSGSAYVSAQELYDIIVLQEYIEEDMMYKAPEVLYKSFNKYVNGLRRIVVGNDRTMWEVVYPILWRMRSAFEK